MFIERDKPEPPVVAHDHDGRAAELAGAAMGVGKMLKISDALQVRQAAARSQFPPDDSALPARVDQHAAAHPSGIARDDDTLIIKRADLANPALLDHCCASRLRRANEHGVERGTLETERRSLFTIRTRREE